MTHVACGRPRPWPLHSTHRCAAKRLRRGLMLCLAAALLGCTASGPDPSAARSVSPTTEIVYEVDKSGRTMRLRMHPGYVVDLVGWWEPWMPKGARPELGQPKSTILLWMLWPTLEYSTPANLSKLKDPKGNGLTILINGLASTRFNAPGDRPQDLVRSSLETALDQMLQSNGPTLVPVMEFKPRHGLRAFGPSLDDRPTQSGLSYQILIPEGSGLTVESNVYLRCVHEGVPEPEASPTSRFVPHCSQRFASERFRAMVDVHYRRIHLSNWRQIQKQVEQKLESFIVEANQAKE